MSDQAGKKAAAELGRRGGLLGGKARSKSLTTERRSEIAQQAAEARWGKDEDADRTPRATHAGDLQIGSLTVNCFVLDNEQRLLARNSLMAAIGMKDGTNPKQGADRLTNFINGKTISPFISKELQGLITGYIRFRLPGRGGVAYGYRAEALVELSKALLDARRAGALQHQQRHLAAQAELIIHGLATVGILALVDEATGYQADRARDALHKVLASYIAKELLPWTKRFPDEFYKEIYRLWNFKGDPTAGERPKLIGKLTNGLVYKRLPDGVLDELQRLNPVKERGQRQFKHHQFLSNDVGHEHLGKHLAVVCALMRVSPSRQHFVKLLDQAVPQHGKNYELPLEDDLAQ